MRSSQANKEKNFASAAELRNSVQPDGLRPVQVAWLAAAVFIVSAGYGALLPVLPAWLTALMPGASVSEVGRHVGFLSGIYAAGVLLGAPLWGVVSDRVGAAPDPAHWARRVCRQPAPAAGAGAGQRVGHLRTARCHRLFCGGGRASGRRAGGRTHTRAAARDVLPGWSPCRCSASCSAPR